MVEHGVSHGTVDPVGVDDELLGEDQHAALPVVEVGGTGVGDRSRHGDTEAVTDERITRVEELRLDRSVAERLAKVVEWSLEVGAERERVVDDSLAFDAWHPGC
jgi:hypothetical protein